MTAQTLDEWVNEQEDLLETFRRQGGSQGRTVYSIPPERTNWIDEQRAGVDACSLGDLSHHMTAVRVEGPDAVAFLEHLCVNDFRNFAVGRGKQIVMCSPDGYVMGDGPLLRLGEREFYGPGIHATKWLRFQYERGDWDVDLAIEPPTPLLPEGETPERFVYQVQGPTTHETLSQLTDADLTDIGFFAFEEVDLVGHDVFAFGHGMSPEAGFELIGPYGHAAEIREAIIEAGAPHGIRELGWKAYVSQSTKVGWVPPWPKPVYESEAMEDYRQWADVEAEHAYGKAYWTDEHALEARFSIEGSLDADDLTDYYLDPVEVGYGKLVDFDHDFIGKEALQRQVDDQERTLVSLLWDDQAVADVDGSLFGDGDLSKPLSGLPLIRYATMPYDEVRADGEQVGVSYTRAYQWDIRGVASLCAIDLDYSEPGTRVDVVWGEPGGSTSNPAIPDHVPTEIPARVAPAPYLPKQK